MDKITDSCSPKKIFDAGLLYHHYANTAYPLTPSSFKDFRIKDKNNIIKILKEDLTDCEKLSIYIHVPFCKVRCKFCEYAVLSDADENTEDLYVDLLLKEISMYSDILKGKKIVGYDLGGGTPTKLSLENLTKITRAVKNSFAFEDNVIFSIETTPAIAAKEPEKIKAVFEMGYERISMGVQTVSEKLLNELGREGATHIYERAVKTIRETGYKRFNIDLMYGFLNQDDEDFENTLKYAATLEPDFITLYRNRYKGTSIEQEAGGVSLYKIIRQYRLAYRFLNENGYHGNPGKNTFSKIEGDYGTSDYLTERVIYGTPYVGMGLGAQSFGMEYLSYNEGAANKKLERYKKAIDEGRFPFQDFYKLNREESIGKMVSVAFYFGFIDFDSFKKRFNLDFVEYFKNEIDFVTEQKLMEIKNGRIMLTDRGSDYINGIIPLFFPKRSKAELMDLIRKSSEKSDGVKEFLKTYDIEDFVRPSIATDIVLFTKEMEKISVLLIKRGEHPFMNQWALPGGFLKPSETVNETAQRELYEETGIENIELSQTGVYSEPKRDPRGWIVSIAFSGIIPKETPVFGEDAIDAKWFSLNIEKKEKNTFLTFSDGQNDFKAILEGEGSITESGDIAFDHVKIIAEAYKKSFES